MKDEYWSGPMALLYLRLIVWVALIMLAKKLVPFEIVDRDISPRRRARIIPFPEPD